MPEGRRLGIGAKLKIDSTAKPIKRLFEGLSPRYGTVIPPDGLHVTLVNYKETAVEIYSEEDLQKLRNMYSRIRMYLGSLALQKTELKPNSRFLKKFGQHLVIQIEPIDILQNARTTLVQIAQEERGNDSIRNNFKFHMAVIKMTKNARTIPPTTIKTISAPIPYRMDVTGFEIHHAAVDPADRHLPIDNLAEQESI